MATAKQVSGTKAPETQAYPFTRELWNVQPNLEEEIDEKRANTLVLSRMDWWKGQNIEDDSLFETYLEDFEGWTKEQFDGLDKDLRRKFRDHLGKIEE